MSEKEFWKGLNSNFGLAAGIALLMGFIIGALQEITALLEQILEKL